MNEPLPPYLRSALFVDFDNIYIRLREESEEAAEHFAAEPHRWLRWLEEEAPMVDDRFLDTKDLPRRILLRRCYLNPRSFHQSRPAFVRAGFEVVDCPPLTHGGKTSSDIRMVMDMMDALSHPSTRFDEMILFSGDADFTPIFTRLRANDRFTVALIVGQASSAYRSACDLLLSADEFVESGLGVSGEALEARREAPTRLRPLLEGMHGTVADAVASTGPVPADRLPMIYKEFSEFREGSDWLGFMSLRGLTEAVVEAGSGLVLREEDPWVVDYGKTPAVSRESSPPPSGPSPSPGPSLGPGPSAPPPSGWRTDFGERAAAVVRAAVVESDEPLSLAGLSHRLMRELGEGVRSRAWQGAGSFRAFLEGLDLEGLEISRVTPGYVYDPVRHDPPAEARDGDEFARRYPELSELARRIHDATDAPYLMPDVYAVMMRVIAEEINERGYHLVRTSKAVRDICNGKGVPVARSHVSFVLKGIQYSGYSYRQGQESAQELGRAFVQNLLFLCDRAELSLSDDESDAVRRWILAPIDYSPGASTSPSPPATSSRPSTSSDESWDDDDEYEDYDEDDDWEGEDEEGDDPDADPDAESSDEDDEDDEDFDDEEEDDDDEDDDDDDEDDDDDDDDEDDDEEDEDDDKDD